MRITQLAFYGKAFGGSTGGGGGGDNSGGEGSTYELAIDLNSYTAMIANLPSGTYEVRVDGSMAESYWVFNHGVTPADDFIPFWGGMEGIYARHTYIPETDSHTVTFDVQMPGQTITLTKMD